MIPSQFAILRKVTRIAGKALVFTDATPDDADFILEIRTDQHKGRLCPQRHQSWKDSGDGLMPPMR